MSRLILTDDLLDQIQDFKNKGYSNHEIAFILNFKTDGQVRNIVRRNGLFKVRQQLSCKNCGNELNNSQKTFCSKSCAATFNNNQKDYSVFKRNVECEKCGAEIEIYHNARIIKCESCRDKRVQSRSYIKSCKGCGGLVDVKNKQYCDLCLYQYYEVYRPSSRFTFNPLDFPEWFDCDLIKKHGRYSPTNKGNNINGISLDHMYSVKDGFINKISPEIISHPANCKLMIHSENSSKYSNSSIDINQLLSRIEEFNERFMSSFPAMALQKL